MSMIHAIDTLLGKWIPVKATNGVLQACPPSFSETGTVNSVSPKYVNLEAVKAPIGVAHIVGAGNISRWELSRTPGAAANPGSAHWFPSAAGDTSTSNEDVILGPITALRFTRVSGTATDTYEVVA